MKIWTRILLIINTYYLIHKKISLVTKLFWIETEALIKLFNHACQLEHETRNKCVQDVIRHQDSRKALISACSSLPSGYLGKSGHIHSDLAKLAVQSLLISSQDFSIDLNGIEKEGWHA